MKDTSTQQHTGQRFHEKHLPTLTHHSKNVFWRLMHIFFPMAIHWMTDKYEGRLHHLVVDVIYVMTTFMFIALNVGLGVWIVRYSTPADISIEFHAPQTITSGKPADFTISYVNMNRDVQDVEVDVFMPDGFVTDDELHRSLGDLAKGDNGRFDVAGVLFGDVDSEQRVRVVTSYYSAGRRQYETAIHTMYIDETSFNVEMDFAKAIAYGIPVTGAVKYQNDSDFAREQVVFTLQFPDYFQLQNITHKDTQLAYDPESQQVVVPFVAAQESGELGITGVFSEPADDNVISGDIISAFSVSASSIAAGVSSTSMQSADHGATPSSFLVVQPRVTAAISATPTVYFGDTIISTVTVQNVGDTDIENVRLDATLSGNALVPQSATATLTDASGTTRATSSGTIVTLPEIVQLPAGAQKDIQIRIPTTSISEQNVSAQVSVSGSGYAPEIDATIPIASASAQTLFHSQIDLSASALYYGPDGEEIGFGSYPPIPYDVTSFRVVLRIQNTNNPLSNVTVRTSLPGQIEWTGLSSVSAGTTIHLNEATREIEWHIGSLAPQSSVYGAQFEVLITPNHLQVGSTPRLTNELRITAQDSWTGAILSQDEAPVFIPVAVETAASD